MSQAKMRRSPRQRADSGRQSPDRQFFVFSPILRQSCRADRISFTLSLFSTTYFIFHKSKRKPVGPTICQKDRRFLTFSAVGPLSAENRADNFSHVTALFAVGSPC